MRDGYREESLWELKERIRDEAEHGVWRTGGGQEIPVEELSKWHLMNILDFLGRKKYPELWEPWVKVIQNELDRRLEDERNSRSAGFHD